MSLFDSSVGSVGPDGSAGVRHPSPEPSNFAGMTIFRRNHAKLIKIEERCGLTFSILREKQDVPFFIL